MPTQKFLEINELLPQSGRLIKENSTQINIADIAERFNRVFSGLNSLETAEIYPLISLKSNYGISVLRDIVETTGSGTVTNTIGDGKYVIRTGTTPGSTAALQSVERGRYVSGTVAIPGQGFTMPQDLQDDEIALWGYFDETGGLGFGADSLGNFVFRRYTPTGGSTSDFKVYQFGQDGNPGWNDPMDGTGPSGLFLNVDAVDIYRQPFRWYGSGPAIFEVAGSGTLTDTVPVHVIEAPVGEPILIDPNLPLRAEITNGTGTRDIEIQVYGRQFSILGRYNPNRRITGEWREALTIDDVDFVPLISFNQKESFASVSAKIAGLTLLASTNNIVYQVRVGGTLTGGTEVTPGDIPANETAVTVNKSATAITGGQSIFTDIAIAGLGNARGSASKDLPDVDLPVNVRITLVAKATTGQATVTAAFRVREEW